MLDKQFLAGPSLSLQRRRILAITILAAENYFGETPVNSNSAREYSGILIKKK